MAASRIKGITVEIGGDTTKLQTALKSVNSEIKNTQSQLKDVEKLLKLDPGNTELLAQKQKLLSSAVSETKEKLTTLKTAAEQANQALANGDISQEQYDALQREIIETENELKKLEEQANQSATAVQKIASAGETLKSTGDKVTAAGEKLLPATAAVTALGVAAVKTASDFDSSMSQVAAVSGATGDDFDKLRDKAREMGAKTKFSASETADAMNYMAIAGWKTEDMLKRYTDDRFRRHTNYGEQDMFLCADHHEAIVSHEDFDKVREILDRRAMEKGNGRNTSHYQKRYAFSGRILHPFDGKIERCYDCMDQFSISWYSYQFRYCSVNNLG